MKKKILTILCICLVVLSACLLGACGDDKTGDKTDPIIGTWVGRDDARNRDFYITISNQNDYSSKTTFDIEIKEIEHDTLNIKNLDTGKINKTEKYIYKGNLTHLPIDNGNVEYEYLFDINNNNIEVSGQEFGGGHYNATYIFVRSDLMLEQFHKQIKDSLIVNTDDPIIGNWVWKVSDIGEYKYSFVEITISTEYPHLIDIKVKDLKSGKLTSAYLCKGLYNSKNLYKYIGESSPFGEYGKDEFEYEFKLDENELIAIEGKEKKTDIFGYSTWREINHWLRHTDLTLEQFEEQLKAV